MVIRQGDIWWADLGEPTGSEPGYRRPVVIVQNNSLNRSRLKTAVCVPLTSNLRWTNGPGNVVLPSYVTGLPSDSVAIGSQIFAVDAGLLIERVGALPESSLELVLIGINIVLGRD